MNAIALILVANAAILTSMSGPTLPDDFNKQGEVSFAPLPTVRFSTVSSGVVTTPVKTKTRWFVSESWCVNCPQEKAKFLASGGDPKNVITIAEAFRRHRRKVGSVPFSYETEETIIYTQPPTYRFADMMDVPLDGDHKPPKHKILNHLRTGGPHQGKAWQKWNLESWNVQQLYALHDDDHASAVPTFDKSATEVVVEGATLSPENIAAALAAHLIRNSEKDEGGDQVFGGLFDIEVKDHPDIRKWASDLLGKKALDFPSAGVHLEWPGERTFSVKNDRIDISPGVKVSVTKFRVTASTTLTSVSYAADMSWLKLSLTNAPDLTVRFVP